MVSALQDARRTAACNQLGAAWLRTMTPEQFHAWRWAKQLDRNYLRSRLGMPAQPPTPIR